MTNIHEARAREWLEEHGLIICESKCVTCEERIMRLASLLAEVAQEARKKAIEDYALPIRARSTED